MVFKLHNSVLELAIFSALTQRCMLFTQHYLNVYNWQKAECEIL